MAAETGYLVRCPVAMFCKLCWHPPGVQAGNPFDPSALVQSFIFAWISVD